MLSGRRLRISAQFAGTSDAPVHADVRVANEAGTEIFRGKLTEDGSLTFRIRRVESLRIEIKDSIGHRAVVRVAAAKILPTFQRDVACAVAACLAGNNAPFATAAVLTDLTQSPAVAPASDDDPVSESGFGSMVIRAFIGVAILLGVAALGVAIQHRRRVAKLPSPSSQIDR